MADEDGWVTVSSKKKTDNSKKTAEISLQPQSQPSLPPIQTNPLNDSWICWFHDVNNEQWTLNSYNQLMTCQTVQDFWILENNIRDRLCKGMYYFMRVGYPPIWDHPKNINGCGWTFKIDKKYATKFWENLLCFCIGETSTSKPTDIIGVSISPKLKFVTVRVWMSNNSSDPSQFDKIFNVTKNDTYVINFHNARFTPNKDAHK